MPILLVGNKTDKEEQRQVSFEQGRLLAAKWGCPYAEISCKTV